MGARLVVDQAKTLLMRHARTLRRNSRLGWVRAPNLPAPQMHCTTSGAGRSTRRVSIAVLERAFRRFRGLAGCLGPARHRHALGPLSRSSHDLDQALAHPHGIILTHLQCLTLRHEDEQQPCPTCACRQAHAPGRPQRAGSLRMPVVRSVIARLCSGRIWLENSLQRQTFSSSRALLR